MNINFSHPLTIGLVVVGMNVAYDLFKRFALKKQSIHSKFEAQLDKKADKTELTRVETSLADFKKRIGGEIQHITNKADDTNKKVTNLEKYVIAVLEKLGVNTLGLIDK